ncbi:MAG: Holliday junction branch migration protein RuvA [Chitinophagales bacterium]|nr:Holliday junction branch migration protein RuvA [Chitinophagales bacterium]HAE14511.1 Holliday junction branch migration protein RuvA [Bacteroidota bacterium]MCB9020382.1 Holliday junction branch migration protein RuvA [Chitinophagales bacterium]MCB9021363.1 Holliday junction branch migration protein RuvA [Chitinophagales bacterium]MCB9031682.1 Holliday junction branch migration protein RuvA [Chitinophagales bacterium]
MIAYIRGKIVSRNPASVVLDTGGIGYQLQISVHTYSSMPESGDCLLYCYHYFREDGQSMIPVIYGFSSVEEKDMFIHLISVSGVGANTARMMLSSMSVADLKQAIFTDNDGLIQKIKGVGPKTAKKIVIELKDRIGKSTGTETTSFVPSDNNIREEALSALAMLGFSRAAADKAIQAAQKATPELASVEELVKSALKNL